MGEYGKPGFLHLNIANRWPNFQRSGLELGSDGVLRLFRLPRLETELPPEIEQAPAPTQRCGVAVAANGNIYYSAGDVLNRMDVCSGQIASVSFPGTVLAGGSLIAIGDTASQRVVLLDPDRTAVVEIRRDITAGAAAFDEETNLYIADAGANRIRRFDRFGVVRWDGHAPLIDQPVAIAAACGRIFALGKDTQSGEWEVVSWRPGKPDAPEVHAQGKLQQPTGLAVSDDALYVGDNSLRRVLKISVASDSLIGVTVGYRGPVAALALDRKGGLYVLAGGTLTPLRLTLDAGAVNSGILWGRVSAPKSLPVTWHRAHAFLTPGNDQSHFQFFTAAKLPTDPLLTAPQPFGPGWEGKGLDVDDFFTGVGRGADLWIGVHMFSDGSSTPALSQVKINFDQPTYLSYMPPLYRDQGDCGDFLLRYLSLFESFFTEGEVEITGLPAMFDPDSAPVDILPWLGSWLAIDWDERWNAAKGREVIRKAFDLYGKRGTLEGLREALELFAGVRAVILEPISETAWWGLPSVPDCAGLGETTASTLGFTTGTAAVEPQGAVVGVSAVLDRSHLIRDADFGKPLFDQTAHQFSVCLYAGQISCSETLAKVQEIVEREKPAHTAYQICTIGPRMSVGRQCRIGIDTLVAGTPLPGRLGDAVGLRLGGPPAAARGDLWRVRINTRI